ncbi:NifB/NifX family molybdenum-iron cluster-binding protein [Geotoga petraea]|jgi:predicted Fe-Mo cluster-binding NifX family protein|uniref:Predicted Fe-Mo cluster-binding protein, NifX family n=1 Tax=Geotoga petraea TaxID=28234 RepID=A0A1G6K7A1_9BACT|nr:NifB/NifX family molybdenum-iron cluster-binding protein [Geotoga petraea]MDK2945790.1 hypothetical protein [Geotoga sp.]TGG88437.1 hypothetical protein E4650_05175 [Geotoga petraea]SDC26475.1 Predicted Fe-Mo cluster-binding protein, NifX family [Geotoga petraea]
MKIAIPVLEDKFTESEIYHKFETTKNLALIDLYEDRYNIDILKTNLNNLSLEEISNYLSEKDVEVVIAQKITDDLSKLLSKKNIMVVYKAQGKVENIIGSFEAMLSNQKHGCSGNCNGCGGDNNHENACFTKDK